MIIEPASISIPVSTSIEPNLVDERATTVAYSVVLGCPRSGTTFLIRALTGIPDAECVIGTLLPVAVPHVVRQDLPADIYDALAVGFERSLDAYLNSGRFNSRAAAIQKWFNAPTGLRGLLDALRGRRAVRQLIYKEPFLAFAPEFVNVALPMSRIIHIYRDGRDVANSLVRSYGVLTDENLTHLRSSEMRLGRRYDHRYVPWWVEDGLDDLFIHSTPFVRAVWMWKQMVRRCHDLFAESDVEESGRLLQVAYEDLMRDPLGFAGPILQHVHAEPTRRFYRRIKEAHPHSIGTYRSRDPHEIRAAEAVAGEELALLGYL